MQFDLAMTDELLATTRTVRKRLDLDRPVARETILECLQLAVQAPTGSNRQHWRWIVVDEPEKKARIGAIYKRIADAYALQQGGAELASQDPQVARILESYAWLADNLGRVPAMLIPCIEGRPEPDWTASRVAAHWGSILPAVWSFQLALRARGLGSALTTLHLNEEAEVARLLGVPDGIMQVALLPVGYTRGTDFRRAARVPLDGITHFNAW
jgi:nitroreductase